MSMKIQAFLIAVYLFFAGFIYGNKPVEVEITHCSLDDGVVEVELAEIQKSQAFCVSVTYQNVGRPFLGSTDDHAQIVAFQTVDGERKVLTFFVDDYYEPVEPESVLVRHGDTRTVFDTIYLYPDTTPGTYSIEVQVPGCEARVYEDILILKAA